MEQISRQAALQALRAAIKSVRRTPIRINWAGDERFFIEIRVPRMTERLDLFMTAQMVLGGFGGSDRLIAALQPLILSFRLPAETEDGELVQACYNAPALPDMPAIELTPEDLFSDSSAFNASPLLVTVIITELMELSGRTQSVAAGMTELMDIFPTAATHTTNLLDQGSARSDRPE